MPTEYNVNVPHPVPAQTRAVAEFLGRKAWVEGEPRDANPYGPPPDEWTAADIWDVAWCAEACHGDWPTTVRFRLKNAALQYAYERGWYTPADEHTNARLLMRLNRQHALRWVRDLTVRSVVVSAWAIFQRRLGIMRGTYPSRRLRSGE